jgi:cell division cycle protein 37
VSKNLPEASSTAPSKKVAVELLNPGTASSDNEQSSGADADIEDGVGLGEEDNIKPSKLGYAFAQIQYGDYATSWQFISKNPSVLSERDTDGLLVEAFNNQMEGNDRYARQCVHQALLIQYCRQLGKDGVALFFKRVMTKSHQAQKLFLDDVNSTYHKIKTRAAELNKEQADNAGKGGVEQIQLHAVDPNTTINIRVPPPIRKDNSADPDQPPQSEEDIAARELFESFPPGLQRALESGSLDDVNVVLGKMSVEEAEEIVGKLGDGGMLSLEEGVLDATTEEGQRMVEEISRTGHMPLREAQGLSEDPPMD